LLVKPSCEYLLDGKVDYVFPAWHGEKQFNAYTLRLNLWETKGDPRMMPILMCNLTRGSRSGLKYRYRQQAKYPTSSVFLTRRVGLRIKMNLIKEYDAYILKNAAQISSIESALRTITYILPSASITCKLTVGRFKDAELASETCASSSFVG
jgi:hypothetical protein